MIGEEFITAAAGFPDPFRLLVRESVESTNDDALALGRSGAADGLVVLAHHQTLGRGRRGATWFSASGDALAFSILLRPTEPKSLWPRLALIAGLAIAEAIGSLGVDAGIKWPNDCWIEQKKTAGILVEAGADFVVVGIGLNVNTTDFPQEVAEIATSLRLASGRTFSRADVLSRIIQHFAYRRGQLENSFEEVIQAVNLRCVLRGHHVTLKTAGGVKQGTVIGIAPGGELSLQTDAGLEHLIQADEIRILNA